MGSMHVTHVPASTPSPARPSAPTTAPAPAAGAAVAPSSMGAPPTITQPAGSRFSGPTPPAIRRALPAMGPRLDRTP